ncbi:hypothetical protein [Falsiroseomonas sp.]|uniref:hypothetical protein n=1 Tax=Falsiroseomonas sp. TaxID=2870721 RepID=UPI0027375BA3|nr:hypothetical protein [Falsiroseomonas sp.]MDP3417884.1 hypothetical protein [Falsiroseomonas sp.]
MSAFLLGLGSGLVAFAATVAAACACLGHMEFRFLWDLTDKDRDSAAVFVLIFACGVALIVGALVGRAAA